MARELQAREKEKKEVELRDLAQRARMERGGGGSYVPPPAAARYRICLSCCWMKWKEKLMVLLWSAWCCALYWCCQVQMIRWSCRIC